MLRTWCGSDCISSWFLFKSYLPYKWVYVRSILVAECLALWTLDQEAQGLNSHYKNTSIQIYEGDSISNQPNLFPAEIDLFFFNVIAL